MSSYLIIMIMFLILFTCRCLDLQERFKNIGIIPQVAGVVVASVFWPISLMYMLSLLFGGR